MTTTTMKKIILSATTAMFLTACGSSSSTPTAAEKASAKIQAYAESNKNPKPTVADYVAAGITTVNAGNLAAMNALVDAKKGADVDSVKELNDLVKHIPAADKTAPVITLNGNSTVTLTVGGTYTEAGAKATDNKDAAATITAAIKTTGTVDTSKAGTYIIKYNVTDAAGNKATEVRRTVKVKAATVGADTEAPVITLNGGDVTLTVGDSYADAGATVTDNKDTGLTVTVGGDTVDTATVGTYIVTYNVTDAAGNTATEVTRTVTVTSLAGLVDNGDGTVTDSKTGLTWAKVIADSCTSPMRTPTLQELQTVLDYSHAGAPFVVDLDIQYSGTDYTTSNGWYLNKDGAIKKGTAPAGKIVCVDGSYTPPSIDVTLSDDNKTVTDNNTNLIWNSNAGLLTTDAKLYADANKTCTDAGYRLPTIVELESIYDRTTNTTIHTELNRGGNYWTSTVGANASTLNWAIQINDDGKYNGLSNTADKVYVRCVKNK